MGKMVRVYKVKGNPEKEKENIVFKSRIQGAHLEASSSEKLLILVHGYFGKLLSLTQPSIFSPLGVSFAVRGRLCLVPESFIPGPFCPP